MTTIWRAWIVLLSVAGLAIATGARAASTTNYSDQWWVPSESGWGASVVQQGSTLFVNLLVYGPDGAPLWLTAAAPSQASATGRDTFGGDLWATTGPLPGDASTRPP